MEFDKIQNILALIPYTSPSKGKIFYDHILKYKPKKCLELGFAKGTSVCYMAAALDELGYGSITAVDLDKSYFMEPNIENLTNFTIPKWLTEKLLCSEIEPSNNLLDFQTYILWFWGLENHFLKIKKIRLVLIF